MKHTLLLLLFLAAFTSGCTVYQIDSKDISQDFYAPKTSIDDVVYLEKVDKPYTEIGTVTGHMSGIMKDLLIIFLLLIKYE